MAWSAPIYQVSDLEGLRWVIRGGKPEWPVCDAYTLIAKLPGWRRLGPRGGQVAEMLEAIATMDLDAVHRLPSDAGDASASDATGLDTLQRMRHSAAIAAVFLAAERRAAELDPEAWTEWQGPFCGTEFTWNDTRWKTLGRRAAEAAEAIVVPEVLSEGEARERLDRWRETFVSDGHGEALQDDA